MTLLGKLFRPWDIPGEDLSNKEIADNSANNLPKLSVFLSSSNESVVSSEEESSHSHDHEPEKRRDLCKYQDKNTNQNSKIGDSSDMNQSDKRTYGGRCSSWSRSSSVLSQSVNSDSNTTISPPNLDPLFFHSAAITNLSNLSRSELTTMGLLPPEPPSIKIKRQRPKRFHCPHCQVAFSNNGQLRGHIRIHTGERPFSCEHEGCGKSFTRNEELTRHRRIHSGLRPFPCTYCGKKFGRKDHLKKHTRTHQRPMFNGGMIGFGNPFHPFNPPLVSSEFSTVQPSYGLPFVLSMPPPNAHFHFP